MAGVFLCVKDKWSDRADYMYRLMRIEKKARERMTAGGQQIFAEGDKGQARDKTAATFGVSGETMRKEMQIVENKRRVYKKFRIHKMCSIYSKSVHTTQKERGIHIISCAISTKYI